MMKVLLANPLNACYNKGRKTRAMRGCERMAIPMGEKDRIIRMRKETGMKQVEFAEYFAIPVRTIQEWEHDRRTPPEYLIRLLEYRLRIEGLIG